MTIRRIAVYEAWQPGGTEYETRETLGFYASEGQALLVSRQAAGNVAHLVTSVPSWTAIDLGHGDIALLAREYPERIAINQPLRAAAEALRASARAKLTPEEWAAVAGKDEP